MQPTSLFKKYLICLRNLVSKTSRQFLLHKHNHYKKCGILESRSNYQLKLIEFRIELPHIFALVVCLLLSASIRGMSKSNCPSHPMETQNQLANNYNPLRKLHSLFFPINLLSVEPDDSLQVRNYKCAVRHCPPLLPAAKHYG